MQYTEIVDQFKINFPTKGSNIKSWHPCGQYSVHIRLYTGPELVFTYPPDGQWRCETVDRFIERRQEEASGL